LLVALSIDVFVASFSCGMGKIKIGWLPAICISTICSAVLALSLSIGTALDFLIDEKYTTVLCFVGLFSIGLVNILEYAIKAYIKKYKQVQKQITFKFKEINMVLHIYNDPQAVDTQHSEAMTIRGSIYFALAMSLDGLFGGIGAAFLKINIPVTIAINFAISLVLIMVGYFMGEKTAQKSEKDFGWLSGALFLVLAFRKLF
jgi:putative sporulation protein YtaF